MVKRLYRQLTKDLEQFELNFNNILRNPNSVCLILEYQSKPLGMIFSYIRTSLSSGKKMIIDELIIDKAHQKQGYGRLLLKHCIKLATKQGLECVELACSLTKPGLHNFYEKEGFAHRMKLYSLLLKTY